MPDPTPIPDLHSTGILWYINRVAFHPRGFALAVSYDAAGMPTWSLDGDGAEAWVFDEEIDDLCFERIEKTFAAARAGELAEDPEAEQM